MCVKISEGKKLENSFCHNSKIIDLKHYNILKINLLESAFLILFFALSVFSEKTSIAVTDLEGTLEKKELATLTDRLVSQLARTDKYVVLERNQMAQILKEQGFQQTGCTSTECAVEAGQLLGVQSMVAGNIGRLGKIYSISLRMIDVKTGRITASANVDIDGSIEDVLKRGIPQIVTRLVSPDAAQGISKSNLRKAGGISSIVLGSAAAGSAVYFLVQKNRYHNEYRSQKDKSDMDLWFGKEKTAYYAFLGSAIGAGITVPVSFLLLRNRGKNKKPDNTKPLSFNVQGFPAGLLVTVDF